MYKMNIANIYWENRFDVGTKHHSNQNAEITTDFIKTISEKINTILLSNNSVIEIGCGTGELTYELSKIYDFNITGTDLSKNAIDFANKNYSSDKVDYKVFDCINDEIDESFDLVICSNTLEHFKDPYKLIDKMLCIADNLIILVPYNQPITDGYECEGGAGHVFHFKDDSFINYDVMECYTFSTNGWQHSSGGETPLQLCVWLKRK